MSLRRHVGYFARPQAAIVTLSAGLLLSGCSEVEESDVEVYQPAQLKEVGQLGLKQVTFTAEGARRVDLQTTTVLQRGGHRVIDYAALIYDGEGASWVYTAPGPLTFLRAKAVVDRVEGNRVFLSAGPPAGTKVVTVGATEVYGAELEIAGGH